MPLPGNTMIGLEVHMQIDVGKLFCNCKSEGELLDASFTRRLHSTSGEIGSKDISTNYEESRDRLFKYIISGNSCLIEADEEPPKRINPGALKAALSMSLAFGSSILERVSVMRKVVIDGSNTGGFQRTSLVAIGGEINSGGVTAGITSICLEEDSCKKVDERENLVTYSLDRLGLPLIEISTAPDMKSADEAIAIAKEIGNRMMVLGLLRKGADSIRQDVNFSMGYGRVEIKGVSKLSSIKEILEDEAKRQEWLSKAVKIVKERGGYEELKFTEVSSLFRDSNSKMVIRGIEEGKRIFASKLSNFRGVMKTESFRVGREIADALKQININGVIHYEELPAYGLTLAERDMVAAQLELKENDSFLMLIINSDSVNIAKSTIESRIGKILSLDFSETRAALADNSTRYMRPLSGSSRMYPETDIPVITISSPLLESATEETPQPLSEFTADISKKYGISGQDAETLISERNIKKFTGIANDKNGKIISRIINQTIPELNKKYQREIEWENIKEVLEFCNENSLGRYSMEKALGLIYSGSRKEDALNLKLLRPLTEGQIKILIERHEINLHSNIADIMKKLNALDEGVVDPLLVAGLLNTEKNKGSN